MNRSGRHPHEVALLFVCVLYGVVGLCAYDRVATTTVDRLGEPIGYAWFAAMTAGGLIALLGLFYPFGGIKGLLVEQGALLILAAIWFGYALAVVATSGVRGTGFFLVVAGFGTANVYRALKQIPAQAKLIAAAAAVTNRLDELEDGK